MRRRAERRCALWSRIRTENLAMHKLDSEDYEQVDAWRAFLDFERANPMQLEPEAFAAWMDRCVHCCLGCCQYSPDMWLYCIELAYGVAKSSAMDLMEQAVAAMPNCLLLRIRICEFFEAIGELGKAESEYRRLVKDCKTAIPWIMYQQFARRHAGIQAARDVFERARLSCKDPSLYIAAGFPFILSLSHAAHLEKDVNHQPESALAVLRFGFLLFSRESIDPTYVLDMVDLLLELGHVANARIILRQAIEAIGEANAPALWERLLQLQARFFATPTALNEESQIERRYAEVNPQNRKLQGLLGSLHRYCQYGVGKSGNCRA